ncbi:unnamed protein product [Lepidochelys olivacea]
MWVTPAPRPAPQPCSPAQLRSPARRLCLCSSPGLGGPGCVSHPPAAPNHRLPQRQLRGHGAEGPAGRPGDPLPGLQPLQDPLPAALGPAGLTPKQWQDLELLIHRYQSSFIRLMNKAVKDAGEGSKHLNDLICECDPSMERSLKITHCITDDLRPYQEMFEQLKRQQRQLPITMVFKEKQPAADETTQSTSRAEPEPTTSSTTRSPSPKLSVTAVSWIDIKP